MYRCIACGARFTAHWPVCTACFTEHALLPVGVRPRAALDGEVELTDARSLARAVWQTVEVPAFPEIELRRGALVVFVGAAGAGKSTMMARALDSIRGTSLLVSLEEPGGPSLAMRLARLGIKREDLLVASRATIDQLAALVRDRRVQGIAIDSAQRASFEPRELRHMLLTLPSLAFVLASSQVNKSGDLRGSEELRHEADVVIEVADMRWRITKSRYQPTGLAGAVLTGRSEANDAAQ